MKAISAVVLIGATVLLIEGGHSPVSAEPNDRVSTVSHDMHPQTDRGLAGIRQRDHHPPTTPDWRIDGLYSAGARRLLVLDDGRRILFEPAAGGAPDRFVDGAQGWRLHGTRGRYRVSDAEGRRATFAAGAPRQKSVSVGPGQPRSHPDCPLDCDTANGGPDPGFSDGPGIPGATRLDLRPGSCRSYFADFPPIERGSHIEAALIRRPAFPGAVPTVRSFPLVDWISDTELVVLHSRDLASAYLDASRDPDALFDRLLADGEAIRRDIVDRLATDGEIVVREAGALTRLAAHPPRQLVLTVVVRHGLASPRQLVQIGLAERELARRHGIELRIIEIP